MPDARAWLAILAVALAPQEGAGDRGKEKDEQEKEKAPWLGPRAPTREERASAEELRKDRELRLERAAASSERLAAFEARLAVDWLAGRPSLARERGLPPLDTAPLELGPDARRTWRGALQRAQGELESVDWPNLDPTRR